MGLVSRIGRGSRSKGQETSEEGTTLAPGEPRSQGDGWKGAAEYEDSRDSWKVELTELV